MASVFYFVVVSLILVLPLVMQYGFKLSGRKMKKVLGVNIIGFFALLLVGIVTMFMGSPVFAAGEAVAGASDSSGFGYLAAALSTGLCGLGAGIGVASPASAAIGAVSEDSGIMGKALIFVALAEGIALYGMLISFMILSRI